MIALEVQRNLTNKILLALLWTHVPLVGGVSFLAGASLALLTGPSIAAAFAATATWRWSSDNRAVRATIAVALMAQISLLVAAFAGQAWQVDIHMSYFAALALIGIYCDPVATISAAAVVAVHHLALNFLLPAVIYPGGGDFSRVMIHAVILIIEATGLVFMGEIIQRSFARSEASMQSAAKAQAEAEAAARDAIGARAAESRGAVERVAYQESVAADQKSMAELLGSGLARVATGDLTVRVDAALEGYYGTLKADFNSAVGKLEFALGEVGDRSRAVRSGTRQITEAAGELARRTEQQAARLEEAASALEQISAAANRSSEGAQQARVVVATADEAAKQSSKVVQQAVEAMSAITESSSKIGQIIGVIDEIAFQTNLLALNAGVEAARAGDSGRGFAVVASEVRALAQRSAAAAKEIKTLISTSVDQVHTGAKLVNETGASLTRIVEGVTQINQVVADIANAAGEQASGIRNINTAVSEIDQWTQQNALMADEAAQVGHRLDGESEGLDQLVGQFQVKELAQNSKSRPEVKRVVSRTPFPASAPKAAGMHGVPPRAARKLVVNGIDDWAEF